MQKLVFNKINDDTIVVKGVIDGNNFEQFFNLNCEKLVFLDFNEVNDITFSGLRYLHKTKSYKGKICCFNVSDYLFCKIKDCGFLNHIDLVRKPVNLTSLDDFEKTGEGFKAVTYNSKDNETILKIYKNFVSFDAVIKDKYFASKISELGIATPMVVNLVNYENSHGIIFERIHGKKSFSRALADNFNDMPNIIKRFVKECKKLHSTKCDVSSFPSINNFFINVVNNSKILNSEEKIKIINSINKIEDTKCCLHGDIHYGNIIFTEDNNSFFIDLSDFASGNYMYDIGILCMNTFLIPEEITYDLYHINKDQMIKCWDAFVREYFETDNQERIEKITNEAMFFAALKILVYASRKYYPWMRPIVEKYLL